MKVFNYKMFKSSLLRILAAVVAFLLIWGSSSLGTRAAEINYFYVNEETGYVALVDDEADLLTDREEAIILTYLEPITAYGNAIYLTKDGFSTSNKTAQTAQDYYRQNFGSNVSGIMFFAHCDKYSPNYYSDGGMDYDGWDYIYAEGWMYDQIGKTKANIITDNIYDEYYFDGAKIAFQQILTILEGGKIAQPMKYICNAFLAVLIGLFVCYQIVNSKSNLKRYNPDEMVTGSVTQVQIRNSRADYVSQTRHYSPRSSGSGGGGHGGGGGGGGHGH